MGFKIFGVDEVEHQTINDNQLKLINSQYSSRTYSIYLPNYGCANMIYFYQCCHCQVGNIVYVFGGYDYTGSPTHFRDKLVVIHLDKWKLYEEQEMTNTPSARTNSVMGHVNGKLYVVGGTTASGPVKEVWEYDIATKVWTELSADEDPYALVDPFPVTTSFTQSTQKASNYNNKLYFTCGSVDGSFSNGMWSFDPSQPAGSKWATLAVDAGMTPRIYCPQTLYEDKIYVLGGRTVAGGTTTPDKTTWMYDITNNTWTQKANVIGYNLDLSQTTYGIMYGNAVTIGKKIYYYDGYVYSGNFNRWVEEYDIPSNTWVRKGSTRQDRYLAASGVYNGSIYILAGQGTGVTATGHANFELIYNPGLGNILLSEL
jgi:hypothetical protein